MEKLENKLNDFLDDSMQVDSGFKIDDEEKANWALRKIANLNKQIEQNNNLAHKEIEKIKEWQKQQNDSVMNDINFFQGLLAEYAMTLRKKDPKFKSRKLPNGRIRFQKKRDKWEYKEDDLINELKLNDLGNLIRVKEEPAKKDIQSRAVKVDNSIGVLFDEYTNLKDEPSDNFDIVDNNGKKLMVYNETGEVVGVVTENIRVLNQGEEFVAKPE